MIQKEEELLNNIRIITRNLQKISLSLEDIAQSLKCIDLDLDFIRGEFEPLGFKKPKEELKDDSL